MELRVVDPDDWQTWREVRLRALQDTPGAFGSTYEREHEFTPAEWRDRLADGTAVIVEEDGSVLSMGAGFEDEPGTTMVVAMWTEPSARGQGAGTMVLDAVVREARARGRVPHLWVVPDSPAQRLYGRAGFVTDGDARELRPGVEVVHLVLRD
jgi:GNAT superfamily N-acetyltransferase